VAAQRRCRQHAQDAPVWVRERGFVSFGTWYWPLCWGQLRQLYVADVQHGRQVGWRVVGQVCTRCGHTSVDLPQVQALTADDGCRHRERVTFAEEDALGLLRSGRRRDE
jgi:hypothetical protein